MSAIEQARFNPLSEQLLQALTEAASRHVTTRLEALLCSFELRWEDAA